MSVNLVYDPVLECYSSGQYDPLICVAKEGDRWGAVVTIWEPVSYDLGWFDNAPDAQLACVNKVRFIRNREPLSELPHP